MKTSVKNSKQNRFLTTFIAACVLCLMATGCGNRKVEELQAKLLQEKENTIRLSVEKENTAKDLATLRAKVESLEQELMLAQEKLKGKGLELEATSNRLAVASSKITELEAKANSGGKIASSTFKVGSPWWERLFDENKVSYSRDSDGDIVFKIGELKAAVIGQNDTIQLRMHLGKGSTTTANRWNREMRFSTAYVDSDGDIFLKADLDLDKVENEEYVKVWFGRYLQSLKAFAKDYVE